MYYCTVLCKKPENFYAGKNNLHIILTVFVLIMNFINISGDNELTAASGAQFGPYLNTTDDSKNVWTFQDLQNYKFTWKDNGKPLRCVLVHDALSETDKKEISRVVNVNCKFSSSFSSMLNAFELCVTATYQRIMIT